MKFNLNVFLKLWVTTTKNYDNQQQFNVQMLYKCVQNMGID